jgi:hypothetical protein
LGDVGDSLSDRLIKPSEVASQHIAELPDDIRVPAQYASKVLARAMSQTGVRE